MTWLPLATHQSLSGFSMPGSKVSCFAVQYLAGKAIDFSEIDLETSEVLFEWSSLDHVSPDGKLTASLQIINCLFSYCSNL